MNSFDKWIKNTPVSHKGLYNEDVPENSIGAIKKALEKEYAIMLDVRALSDNTIVVFSDSTLGRMTGSDGFVRHLSSKDLESICLVHSKEQIPTLKKTLEEIDGKVPVIINIKSLDTPHFEKFVWKVLQNYSGEYAVASANPFSLEWFKEHAPKVKRGQISSFYKDSALPYFTKKKYKKLRLNNVSEPNFIIYNVGDLPNKYVKKYKELPLLAEHVKTAGDLERAKKFADNYIFENLE